jgi:hypothetical protein
MGVPYIGVFTERMNAPAWKLQYQKRGEQATHITTQYNEKSNIYPQGHESESICGIQPPHLNVAKATTRTETI